MNLSRSSTGISSSYDIEYLAKRQMEINIIYMHILFRQNMNGVFRSLSHGGNCLIEQLYWTLSTRGTGKLAYRTALLDNFSQVHGGTGL